MKNALALFVPALVLICCTSSIEPDCPFPASSCPSGCYGIDASELDRAKQCRVDVVLGCKPAGSSTSDTVCYIHESGRIVQTGGDALTGKPGWRKCSGEEEREIISTALCSDFDGGRNPGPAGSVDAGAD